MASNSAGTSFGEEDQTFTVVLIPILVRDRPGLQVQAPPDTTAPAFLAAASTGDLRRRQQGARETPVAARAKKGTTFRFRLSEAARVVFVIERPQAGRRVGRRRVKLHTFQPEERKCTRFTVSAASPAIAPSGDNVKKFSGLIGKRGAEARSPPGHAEGHDAAGNASPVKRLNFRVVRR